MKLRISRHQKAERPLPIFTWEELDQSDQAKLLEGVKEDAEHEVIALQNAMRGRN